MKNSIKYVLVIVIIAVVAISVYAYTLYQGETNEFEGGDLVDDMGYSLTLTEPPERIVSLSPGNTEILFAIGAGDKVVGVTDYCDYPYNFTAWVEAGNMTSIGNFWQPSIEPIVDLDPDLVLASTGSLEAADNLRNLGINVLVIDPKIFDEVFDDITLLGRATNNVAKASEVVNEMTAKLDDIASQISDASSTPTVYYEVWYEPLQSVGPETFIDEMITLAGGENIFHDATTSWPQISSESVIDKNPDVLVFPDMYMGVGNFYDTIETVASRSGWDVITAVQNDALYEIDADITSRGGPRIVDAVEAFAQAIHPEIFG